MRRPPITRFAPLLLVAVAGCGSFLPGPYVPALLTIEAKYNGSPPDDGNLALAIRWQDAAGANRNSVSSVTQNGSIRFGSNPTFILTAAPPTDAMLQAPAGGGVDPRVSAVKQYARGTLIVYRDKNMNKAFDRSDRLHALGPGDDVVEAVARSYTVFYLVDDGTPAPAGENGVDYTGRYPTAPGFSVVVNAVKVDPGFGDCPVGSRCEQKTTVKARLLAAGENVKFDVPPSRPDDPPADPLDGPTSTNLQRYACDNYQGPGHHGADMCSTGAKCDGPRQLCVVGESDLPLNEACLTMRPPPSRPIQCVGDSYIYADCVQDEDQFCGTIFCHFGHGEPQYWSTPGVKPPEWPCPRPSTTTPSP